MDAPVSNLLCLMLFCWGFCQVVDANESTHPGAGIWRPSRKPFPARIAQMMSRHQPVLTLRNDRPSQFNPVGDQQQQPQQQFNNQRPHYPLRQQIQPLFFWNNNNNKNSRFPFSRPTTPDHYQQQPSNQQNWILGRGRAPPRPNLLQQQRRPIHVGPQQPQPRPGPNQSGQTGQQQGPAQTVQQQRPPVVYTDVQVSTETSELDKQAQQNLLQLQLGGDEFLTYLYLPPVSQDLSEDAQGSATSNNVIVAQPHPEESEKQRGQVEPAPMTPYDPYRFRSIDSSTKYGTGFSILDDDWIPIDSPWKAPQKDSPSPLNDADYEESKSADLQSEIVVGDTEGEIEGEVEPETYNEE